MGYEFELLRLSLHMTVKRKYVQNFRDLRFTDVLERATELQTRSSRSQTVPQKNRGRKSVEQGVFSTTDFLKLDVKTEPKSKSTAINLV